MKIYSSIWEIFAEPWEGRSNFEFILAVREKLMSIYFARLANIDGFLA